MAFKIKSLLSISLQHYLLVLSADFEETCIKSTKVPINLENHFIKLFVLTCNIWIEDKNDKPTTALYFIGHFSTNFSTSLMRNDFAELRNSLCFDFLLFSVYSGPPYWFNQQEILFKFEIESNEPKSWRKLLQHILQIVPILWVSNPSTVRTKIQPVFTWLKKELRKVPCPLQRWARIHSKQNICSMLHFETIKEIAHLWQGSSWLLSIFLETLPSFELLLKM